MPRALVGYSKNDVVRAGKLLATVVGADDRSEEVIQAFKIANSWISSHAYPLALSLNRLKKVAKRCGVDGQVVGREKRLASVRRKLASRSLTGIQDLGGARIIVRELSDLNRLTNAYREGLAEFEIHRIDDYVANPKRGGYRSVHVIQKMPPFDARGRASHANQRIEVQLRTQLQHEWATAVEAIGLLLGVRMKNAEGDARWLRLFELMGDVYRADEMVGDATPLETVEELRSLEREVGALRLLDSKSISEVVNSRAGYTILDYDMEDRLTRVRPIDFYDEARRQMDNPKRYGLTDNAVLLQAAPETDLRSAYPNYFIEVPMFRERLASVCQSRKVADRPRLVSTDVPLAFGQRRYVGLRSSPSEEEKNKARAERKAALKDLGYDVG